MSGDFILRNERRAAKEAELIFSEADGGYIYLKNRCVLVKVD